jgi:predicted translin family RNA/ssDNA-binding protein
MRESIADIRETLVEVKAVSENNVQAIAEMRGTIERMIQLVALQQGNQEGTQAQLKLLEERVTRLESQ